MSDWQSSPRNDHRRYRPPLKDHPVRMSRYREGSTSHNSSSSNKVSLVTNAYSISLSLNRPRELTVYRYSLSITIAKNYRDVSPLILYRNFVARSLGRVILNMVIPDLYAKCSHRQQRPFDNRPFVIDQSLNSIYSLEPLHRLDNQDFIAKFENTIIEADLLRKLYVDIEVKFQRALSLEDLQHNFDFLSAIMHHDLWLNMIRFGSVYFTEQSSYERLAHDTYQRLDLMSDHAIGLSTSKIRKIMTGQNIVNISCSHAYLTKAHYLIDLLASFILGRPVQGLILNHSEFDPNIIRRTAMSEILRTHGTEDWFETFSSILNGFKCQAMNGQERVNLRFNLSLEPASVLIMSDKQGYITERMTVQEYYRHMGVNLNYPNLPCLISTSFGPSYYPFEMCSLLPNQKVPIFRLSAAARLNLNNLNKPKPELFQELSHNTRNNIAHNSADKFRTFGLSLSENPVKAEGSILLKPSLQFRNTKIEPQRDSWESGVFYQAMQLVNNWCVVDTVEVDNEQQELFFKEFSRFSEKFGFVMGRPYFLFYPKQDLLDNPNSMNDLITRCHGITNGNLRFLMFVIDSSSTPLNRAIHLTFDARPELTAMCLRTESISNCRFHRAIFRTLIHKLNARLGGTNVTYNEQTLGKSNLNCNEIMIVGLDVTHPDNELNGVSIVGCAYTYKSDLFRHRSLVWPQTARVEIINKMDVLMNKLLREYHVENDKRLPKHIVIYRDGVSHEEFDRVNEIEVGKALRVIKEIASKNKQPVPKLSFIIAQKRHTMRYFQMTSENRNRLSNPPSGTLINQDIVTKPGKEFYLYSNTNPHATARPLHYNVLLDGLGIDNLQNLTYYLCFNFGKCSGTLSMPSSLRYAHNAAYDARSRVLATLEFDENKFYTNKFFC